MKNLKAISLLNAIFQEDISLVTQILEECSVNDVNFWDENLNSTPLIKAIDTNSPQIVELILKKGADPNFFTSILSLPLIRVLELAMEIQDYEEETTENSIKILNLILVFGGDINKENYDFMTPYQYAKGHFPQAIPIFDKYRN